MNFLVLALTLATHVHATDCHLSTEYASGQVSRGRSIPLVREFALENGRSLYGSAQVSLAPNTRCQVFTLSELPQGRDVVLDDRTSWMQKSSLAGTRDELVTKMDRQLSSRISLLVGHFARSARPDLGQLLQVFENPRTGFAIGLHCVSDHGFNQDFTDRLALASDFNVCAPTAVGLQTQLHTPATGATN